MQTHPIQYYAPLYAELAKRDRLDVHVVYLTDAGAAPHLDEKFGTCFAWDIPLLEGYLHTILQPGSRIEGRSFLTRDDPRLSRVLKLLAPDWVLVYGYASAFIWRAVVWAKIRGVRIAYTSDSNLRDQRRGMRLLAKHALLRPFFKMFDLCFATSEANEAYLAHYGVAKARIRRMPFAIDVARFQYGAPPVGMRRKYDFIWVGKLDLNKRPFDFVSALTILAAETKRNICAAIVGEGAMRASLEGMIMDLPDNCSVELLGFINQRLLPCTFQSADTLCFTSHRDAYGLTATEAAAAGLALVVSQNLGCVGPTVLARPGVNARVYPSGDVVALATEMRRLIDDTTLLHEMQAASRAIAGEHDLAVAADIIESTILRGDKS